MFSCKILSISFLCRALFKCISLLYFSLVMRSDHSNHLWLKITNTVSGCGFSSKRAEIFFPKIYSPWLPATCKSIVFSGRRLTRLCTVEAQQLDKGSYSHKDPQTRGLALYLCPMSIVYLAITLVFIRHQARNIEVLGASSRCTGCYQVNLTGQGGVFAKFSQKNC